MSSIRPHILVVDDDATQGQALAKAFDRSGFDSTWCPSAAKALTMVNLVDAKVLLIDCMLPRMNGIELALELHEVATVQPLVYLMSGVYKDKTFIRDAIAKTKARDFFIKPVDLPSLIDEIRRTLQNTETSVFSPWLELYRGKPLSSSELIRLLADDQSIMTAHLPMLYWCMSEAKLSGELQLSMNDGRVFTLLMCQGRIFSIQTPDTETYFGALAVSFGFITPEDLYIALNTPGKKRLGEKLIDGMSLSPHALQVILDEQLALRLSQTIGSGAVALQWSTKTFPDPECYLKKDRIDSLIDDWVVSKLNSSEIAEGIRPWSQIQVGDSALGDFLLDSEGSQITKLPKLLNSLIRREVSLNPSATSDDLSRLESRMDRLLADFAERNHFQILGLSERAHANEVRKAFLELSPYYDPSSLPDKISPAAKEKAKRVYQLFCTAKDTLTDDMAREQYVNLLRTHRAQKRFEAEPKFNVAVMELENELYESAEKKFQSLLSDGIDYKDLKAYRIWAGLKVNPRFNKIRLEQISPEERQSPVFHMAKGVDYTNKGQFQAAVKAFRTAYAINPRLKLARKELKELFKTIKRKPHHAAIAEDIKHFLESTSTSKKRSA